MKLTPKEHEIMTAVSEGLTNWQIAMRLKISEQTVKNHLYMIYRKLQATNRVTAINTFNTI